MVTAAVSADRRGSGRRAVPFGTGWGVDAPPQVGCCRAPRGGDGEPSKNQRFRKSRARERWHFPICELVENKERSILRLQKF